MKMRKNNVVYRFFCLLIITCLMVTGIKTAHASADEYDVTDDMELTGIEYSYDEIKYFIDTDAMTAEVAGSVKSSLKTLTIPDTITYDGKSVPVVGISDYAFEGSSLTSVKLGVNIKEIGEGAFAYSENLKKLTISKKCSKIDSAAFFMCTSLNKISINKKAKLKTIGDGAFAGTAITGFTITDAVTSVGDAAFAECTSLNTVTLGTKLKSIGEGAFAGCNELATVKKASGNKNFEVENNVIYSAGFEELVSGAAASDELKIKDGTQSIKARAFEGNEKLIVVEIPDSVELIGECAFINCAKLNKINVIGGFKETESNIFYGCESLEMVQIITP